MTKWPEHFWVGELRISEATAQKILNRHGVHADEVRGAIVMVEGLRGRWDHHEERGLRMIAEVSIADRTHLAVLYPRGSATDDSWNLGSIYPR